jgi:epoxyqueuosine reductase
MFDLKERIKAEAASLGFSFCSFTAPGRPLHYRQYLEWLSGGYAAGMDYLNNDRTRAARANPAALLPDAQTLIVLGYPYKCRTSSELQNDRVGAPSGRIASYALYQDYHQYLREKSKLFAAKIDQHSGRKNQFLIFIDSSAILEKDTALMAGAGWIGKNSLLITPDYGSFQYLAVLLTDLKVEPDEPFTTDLCRQCRRCITACPSGCITENHSVDANRCIAYLTIEHKGIIPSDLRAVIADRIFGCEECQIVCPHNKNDIRVLSTQDSRLMIEPKVDLIREMELSAEDFQLKYGGTPISRATFQGFRRNLIVAMGNSHRQECLPILENTLFHDPSWLLRLHAAWAISAIMGQESHPILKNACRLETDKRVESEILFLIDEQK